MDMTPNTTPTALVLVPVPRCPWGTDSHGHIAQPLDRVEILDSRTSTGGKQYRCRTEAGELFFASDTMIQPD